MDEQLDLEDIDFSRFVFPPYMSRFLVVTFSQIMTIAGGAVIGTLFFTSIDPKWVMAAALCSVLIFVFFNILVTRGYKAGILGLKILSAIFLIVALTGLFLSGYEGVCILPIATAVICLITIHGDKYQEMFGFMQRARDIRRALTVSLSPKGNGK